MNTDSASKLPQTKFGFQRQEPKQFNQRPIQTPEPSGRRTEIPSLSERPQTSQPNKFELMRKQI